MLAVEREELGIVAGLQDRVVQEYDGLVYMDFAKAFLDARQGAGDYEPLDADCACVPSLRTCPVCVNDHVTASWGTGLPPLYLAYMVQAGGDSGKIHSDVRRRWDQGDAAVVQGMQTMGAMTDRARACLLARDYATLGDLMDSNFDLRRALYTDAVTGADNLRFVALARCVQHHHASVHCPRASDDGPWAGQVARL
jgi:glucuronokinase